MDESREKLRRCEIIMRSLTSEAPKLRNEQSING